MSNISVACGRSVQVVAQISRQWTDLCRAVLAGSLICIPACQGVAPMHVQGSSEAWNSVESTSVHVPEGSESRVVSEEHLPHQLRKAGDLSADPERERTPVMSQPSKPFPAALIKEEKDYKAVFFGAAGDPVDWIGQWHLSGFNPVLSPSPGCADQGADNIYAPDVLWYDGRWWM